MCSDIDDIFGYASISYSGAGKDRISIAMGPALEEDLTQEDIADTQTNPKRVTICHVPQGGPKIRHIISAGSYADSGHVYEYSDYLTASILLIQYS